MHIDHKTKKILIIGAGPAGLAAGYELSKYKGFNINIIETDSSVGGISKTIDLNGYKFDLGGHRFFSKIDDVNKLWKELLGKEFIERKRLSRIYYNYKFYNYPIKLLNAFLNLGPFESFLIFISYLNSKLFPYKNEDTFEEWVSNRFGKRLYKKFFKTYTEKLWGIPCSEIKAEWASQRIKGLSLTKAILNIFEKKTTIKTLIDKFMYPKYGPGMMYEKMAEKIKEINGKILLNHKIIKLERKNKRWVAKIENKNKIKTIIADEIISSMPITELVQIKRYTPAEVINYAKNLNYRSFMLVALVFDKPTLIEDNWIYVHDKRVKLGRLQILYNWSKDMVKNPNHSSYGAEYFCTENDELWSMENENLIKLAEKEVKEINLIPDGYNLIFGKVIRCAKAYPVYDSSYASYINILKDYVIGLPNLQVVGRAGMFKYNNMDHSIYTGLLAARNINLNKHYDIWKVNQDEEYHETNN